MDLNCTEPLGDNLELYLSDDLEEMCNELLNNGIIFEYQFENLISMVCKRNASGIVKLLSEKTQLNIRQDYDDQTKHCLFYDINRYTRKEAINKSISYQESKYNY